jgi:aspartate aminotransferase-like enzyme
MCTARPPRLFIPGPVEVEYEVLKEMSRPMIGHRTAECREIFKAMRPLLAALLRTENPVYVLTSSATGAMEAAAINCARKKVLACVNGDFSDRFGKICASNRLEVERIDVEWGKPIRPEMVRDALRKGGFDAVTLVHNETSTGVMSPLAEIALAVAEFEDVVLLVDAVTSAAVVPIECGKLPIDVLVTGSQKGLALPPGLALLTASPRAMARAKEKKQRGTYFDLVKIHESWEKDETPATPAVSLLFALKKRLEIIAGDEDGWYRSHQDRAELTRKWARERFALFPEKGYESVSLTCVANTRGISVADLNAFLRERGVTLSNGYKALKEKTFRIGHMGANDLDEHRQLLAFIDEFLGA